MPYIVLICSLLLLFQFIFDGEKIINNAMGFAQIRIENNVIHIKHPYHKLLPKNLILNYG